MSPPSRPANLSSVLRLVVLNMVLAAAAAAPPPAGAAEPRDRLVVAVVNWGSETPFGWKSIQLEKNLWEPAFDPLIVRDPKTFEYRPGLAIDWKPSKDYKTWTIKLRQGVMFHEGWGELTADDVKFNLEQSKRPDASGAGAPFLRSHLEKIETPDKYTVVLHFRKPIWYAPSSLAQITGYQNIISKKYLEAVGEGKAAQHPIGTGPYRHVEGRQGDYHRFEAVPNHWRRTPAFKELVIRRIPDPATIVAGLRAGEIDIAAVTGDYLAQAKKAGLGIVESPGAMQFWIQLPGLTTPDREDYCPKCPWVGDPSDPKSLENGRKVRLGLNLAVNKQAIIQGLWMGYGADPPFSYWYYPFHKGYSRDWKVPPYDPQRAKRLLAEAGYPSGFEIKMNPYRQNVEAADVMEAVALDWEKVGVRVKRVEIDIATFSPMGRARKTGLVGRPYSPPSAEDEPAIMWERTMYTRGAFNLLMESPATDKRIDAILAETDPDKRARMTAELGNATYHEHYGVMIGVKSATWAVSRKVGNWVTLPYTSIGTNYESITPPGK